MAEYKWIGDHAQDLASGQMLAPGETVELSEDDLREAHNESLVADGGLIPVDEKGEHEAELAARRVGSRVRRQENQVQEGDTVPDPAAEGKED